MMMVMTDIDRSISSPSYGFAAPYPWILMADQKEPLKRQTSPTQRIRHASPRLESPDGIAFQALAKDSSTVAQKTSNRQVTMEGFRSLGVMATFFAGLQAQMLSLSFSDNSTTASRLVNAFWLAGIVLDVFGAMIAILTARWFEVLDARCVEIFDHIWSADPTTVPQRKYEGVFPGIIDAAIANSLFSGFAIVGCGVTLFLIGLVICVWERQPLLVSIIFTIPFAVLVPLVAVVFIPHSTRKENIVQILKGKKGEW